MGYFDGFTANLFREREDGQRVIAPFGSLGRVYVIPTDADAARITSAVQRMYQVMFIGILGTQFLLGWRWDIVVLCVLICGFFLGMHLLTRDLPRTDLKVRQLVPISRGEMQARMGRALGRGWSIVVILISVVFVAVGLIGWFTSHDLGLLASAGFFALCGILMGYQFVRARRQP